MAREFEPTFDLLGIGGASVMSVNLFGCSTLVEGDESVKEVVACCIVVVSTIIIGEVVTKRRLGQFFGKEINFIQEQNLTQSVGGDFRKIGLTYD
jgi:hypothetical protein